MNLQRRVQRFLRQSHALPAQSRVLVAVSGGQDSLCLLDMLHHLRPRWGWVLGVAHCDHGWRPDSTANAQYVGELAQRYGYPFHLVQATDLPQQEAAARQWRYQALVQIAQQHQYTYIATGHTASDRVETFLFNLWRGSGLSGLVALVPIRPLTPGIQLVRPLWDITREETAAYCQHQGLTIWPDSTNQTLQHRRNRIRHELIPYLRRHFNPQIERQLLQTLDILTAEQQFWQQWVNQVWPQLYDPQRQALNRRKLAQLPLAGQRHILRVFLQKQLGRPVTFYHIEQVRHLATAGHRSQTAPLPGGKRVVVQGDVFVMTD